MNENWQILQGDCAEQLRKLPDACIDALVTDPPYGLGKELAPAQLAQLLTAWIAGERVDVKGRGFMAREWDSYVPGPHVWREVYRVLKPGAHLAVFAGSRTFDLMGLSLRLAGFEMRDSITLAGWLYGSGFPKSLNVGDGRGTALKPAFEPILLMRKPLAGTVAANVLAHGTGAINVDACRVECEDKLVRPAVRRDDNEVLGRGLGVGTQVEPAGRWPANLLLVHSPYCIPGTCAAECPTRELDAQSGVRRPGERPAKRTDVGFNGRAQGTQGERVVFDAGGASRYFSQFYYDAKASRKEREAGCEALPTKSGAEAVDREPDSAGVRNPRAGAGRTSQEVHNWHPTVKPLSVMRWLVRLITPVGGVVLDPFAGSGTTLAAAVLEGREALGVELLQEHVDIANARVSFWESERDK
jgi:DNA modification methylase